LKKNKNATCHVPCVTRGIVVPHGITMSRVSVTIRCHCVDFNL